MKDYLLALDEGTTSARAILFDRGMRIVSMAQHEIACSYPRDGYVEQDPLEIYAAQMTAMVNCVGKSGIPPQRIAAAGITNQRETVIVWERATGRPIHPAIVWQCRRTAPLCEAMEAEGHGEAVRALTGLRLDPYFSATKIAYILDTVKGARERAERGELCAGTVDTWLLWKMTEGKVFFTDKTNASRTMLYNIHTGEWDERLLALFRVPRALLPEVGSSGRVYGRLSCLGESIPVASMVGDQQAALFGQGCFAPGEATNTYGTGCFLLAHTGEVAVESRHGLLTTVAATLEGEATAYALEGSVFVGGALVRWLRDELGLIPTAAESETAARRVPSSLGVYVVPAFAGLGTPYWDARARGTILGLTGGTGRDHIVRASLEAIAYQTEDVIAAMNAAMPLPIRCLRVGGGASANRLLLEMQSDISGIDVERAENVEATAVGAALLAGLAVGFFRDRGEVADALGRREVFSPTIDGATRAERIGGWRRAVRACRAFSAEDTD